MYLLSLSRKNRVLVLVLFVISISCIWYQVEEILEQASKPLPPGSDPFFITWRNTDNPPLYYQDENSDEVDAWIGRNENNWKLKTYDFNSILSQ